MSRDTGPLADIFVLQGKAEHTGSPDDRANAFVAEQIYKAGQREQRLQEVVVTSAPSLTADKS